LVQLNVSLIVTQSKFKPSKSEIRLPRQAIRQAAPAAICSWLSLTG